MSGTLIFKPMEAKLTHDTDTFSKMDPYCLILLAEQKVSSKVCNGGGKHPKWHDENLVVERKGEPVAFIEIKDKDTFSSDDIIGVVKIDLTTLTPGVSAKWWPVYWAKKQAGELLCEIIWTPDQNEHVHSHHQHNTIIHPHWCD